MLMLIQLYIQSFEPIPDFNTSHVNVNQFAERHNVPSIKISIHLMLMLIHSVEVISLSEYNFNISHVNVNHKGQDLLL